MKAIAVIPGKQNSIHLAELPEPDLTRIPNGRGVVVRVLRVGVDGTDREINAAEYGQAPAGSSFLVLGHESFGEVVAVGANVTELVPGDLVVATVRRRSATSTRRCTPGRRGGSTRSPASVANGIGSSWPVSSRSCCSTSPGG